MKKLIRPEQPNNYNLNSLSNYENLLNPNGTVRSRWNSDTSCNRILKETLLKMCGGECSYCGKILDEWDIDHYLPKTPFKYLSYSYENMLPSCKRCNQDLKKDKYPKSLSHKINFAEKHIYNIISGLVLYERESVLRNTEDRILEPSFDFPEEHLEFDPTTCEYKAKTRLGRETKKVFFEDNKYFTEKLQSLSNQIFLMIQEGSSKNTVFNMTKITGYSYYIEKLYDYWIDFF